VVGNLLVQSVKVHAVSRHGGFPVLLNRYAHEDRRDVVNDTVDHKPNQHYPEILFGCSVLEEAVVLRQDRELDDPLAPCVKDDGPPQPKEKVLKLVEANSVTQATPDFCLRGSIISTGVRNCRLAQEL